MSPHGNRRGSPRVQLYERIVAAINDGTFPPDSKLPPEPTLAARLEVSRPALREVLILLQEDGVITRRQGAGSTVNQYPSAPGLERLLPIEQLLTAGTVRCRRIATELEEPTDFSGYHLQLAPPAQTRFWETVIDADGTPACFAHEWATDSPPPDAATALTTALDDTHTPSDPPRTMLAAILTAAPQLPMTSRATLGATTLGTERGRAVARAPETPATLLTQTVSVTGHPVLVAKYLLPAGAPLLHLTHRR